MVKQTAGHDQLGNFAEKFAQLNDDVLFGEVWSREDKLSLRDRSLVTICVFMGKGLVDSSLKYHIMNAKKNGITLSEMTEIVTHAAFYAGWPNAWAVFHIVKEVYQEEIEKNNTDMGNTHGGGFGVGEPNPYGKYFTGQSYLNLLSKVEDINFSLFNVTFEPSCRNNWHIHHSTKGGGQILIVVDGEGWYQEEGKEARSLKVGDVVTIPANVKHWHGAKANSWFSHLAIEVPGEDTQTQWCEPVSDEEYDQLGE
ncbi:MAG: carboxymuconolactone decarboxylase family protein [Clostridia bacterium]|nr:carboxymuconolactone decarboxylase family protein [Clostridia bacterium]